MTTWTLLRPQPPYGSRSARPQADAAGLGEGGILGFQVFLAVQIAFDPIADVLEMVKAAKAAVKDAEDGKKLKKVVNCGACHKLHK